MTTAARIAALKAQIDAAFRELGDLAAADDQSTAATDTDEDIDTDQDAGKPRLLTAADGRAEALRRHPRKAEATGGAKGGPFKPQADQGAPAGRGEARRRVAHRSA